MIYHDGMVNSLRSLPALQYVTSILTTWTKRPLSSSLKVVPFFVFPPKRHCICCHPSIQSGELPSTYSLTGYSHSLSFVPFSSTVMSWLNQNPSKSFKYYTWINRILFQVHIWYNVNLYSRNELINRFHLLRSIHDTIKNEMKLKRIALKSYTWKWFKKRKLKKNNSSPRDVWSLTDLWLLTLFYFISFFHDLACIE